jgi:hypothetical protein
VIGFRIDNRTIKRGIFNCNGYLVPLSVSLICIYIVLSDVVRRVRKPRNFLCEKLSQVLNFVQPNRNFLITELKFLGRGAPFVWRNYLEI